MMDLAGRLPKYVLVGRRYRMRTEFFRVLQVFEILRDKDLLEEQKIYLCLRCLLWRVPRSMKKRVALMQAITAEYIAPDPKKGTQPKSMDLQHDAPYIFAAFWQAYGVDLTRSKMHWWKFRALLSALPDETKMSQIISIRTRPMPKATKYNVEERANLARLKTEWAVYKTDEERAQDFQAGLAKMAMAMHSMAKKR